MESRRSARRSRLYRQQRNPSQSVSRARSKPIQQGSLSPSPKHPSPARPFIRSTYPQNPINANGVWPNAFSENRQSNRPPVSHSRDRARWEHSGAAGRTRSDVRPPRYRPTVRMDGKSVATDHQPATRSDQLKGDIHKKSGDLRTGSQTYGRGRNSNSRSASTKRRRASDEADRRNGSLSNPEQDIGYSARPHKAKSTVGSSTAQQCLARRETTQHCNPVETVSHVRDTSSSNAK
eukprot:769350_1